jgi:excisionase family DNA binding protein
MEGNSRLTYSIPEACALLGISRNLGYDLARRGELPGLIRLGQKRLVVSKVAINRLLQGEGEVSHAND